MENLELVTKSLNVIMLTINDKLLPSRDDWYEVAATKNIDWYEVAATNEVAATKNIDWYEVAATKNISQVTNLDAKTDFIAGGLPEPNCSVAFTCKTLNTDAGKAMFKDEFIGEKSNKESTISLRKMKYKPKELRSSEAGIKGPFVDQNVNTGEGMIVEESSCLKQLFEVDVLVPQITSQPSQERKHPQIMDGLNGTRWELKCLLYAVEVVGTKEFDPKLIEDGILRCNALLDSVWQRLHTGHWSDIPKGCRLLYTTASIILCGLLLQKLKFQLASGIDGNDTPGTDRNGTTPSSSYAPVLKKFKGSDIFPLKDSLLGNNISASTIVKVCDRGLLMGCPIDSNPLPKVASYLNGIARGKVAFEIEQMNSIKKNGNEVIDCDCCPIKFKSQGLVLIDLDCLHQPCLDVFLLKQIKTKSPTKISGIVDEWPALLKWNFSYLRHVAGARTVPVEVGSQYTDSDWSQTLLTLDDYITKYVETDAVLPCGYLAQHQLFDQIPELVDDLTVPDYCHLGECDPTLNVWIGPKGTVTPLHQDPDHNILVQVYGYKYIILYPEDQSEFLYPYGDDLLNNTSQVDLECMDIFQGWPLMRSAKGFEIKLGPGEALYIPPKCWHYVKSLSKSISVSFWWR